MQALKAGLAYGLGGFAAGFVFGALRELVLIPALGEAAGRWIEFVPLICVIILLAFWIVRRFALRPGAALACGVMGVAVLLAVESAFALGVLAMPLDTYLAGFDVTRGALFPFGLLIMALAPPGFATLPGR